MSILVAIEGADGAGKATAAANVSEMLVAIGRSACVMSFPRYHETVGGFAVGNFLSGRTPVAMTPKAAAVLYALDRLESVEAVAAASAAHDVVLFDRYIASNVVYQASKVNIAETRSMMDWILKLETGVFGVCPPDLSIYLDTPLDHSQRLILSKHQRTYTDRQYDEHEADLALQRNVRVNYSILAGLNILGPWHVVKTVAQGSLRSPRDIAKEIVDRILQHPNHQRRKFSLSRIAPSA